MIAITSAAPERTAPVTVPSVFQNTIWGVQLCRGSLLSFIHTLLSPVVYRELSVNRKGEGDAVPRPLALIRNPDRPRLRSALAPVLSCVRLPRCSSWSSAEDSNLHPCAPNAVRCLYVSTRQCLLVYYSRRPALVGRQRHRGPGVLCVVAVCAGQQQEASEIHPTILSTYLLTTIVSGGQELLTCLHPNTKQFFSQN